MTDPVTRSIDQLVGAWRLLCGRGPRHVLASGDGLEYAFSGLPVPFFNLAAVTAHDVGTEALAAPGWRLASMPPRRWTRAAWRPCWG